MTYDPNIDPRARQRAGKAAVVEHTVVETVVVQPTEQGSSIPQPGVQQQTAQPSDARRPYAPPHTRDGVNGRDALLFIGAAVMVWGPLAAGAFLHGGG
ncbi:MAG: hypothetical protein U1E46_09210 [Hyphomicrobiales bacterium]